VLQGQLKHLGGAAQQAHAQAVQHHPLAALERGGAQVVALQPADEPAETAGDVRPRLVRSRGLLLHDDRMPGRRGRRQGCCDTIQRGGGGSLTGHPARTWVDKGRGSR